MTERKVFVSYARADSTQAEVLAQELDQLDQDVWRDVHLSGGQQWWATILRQLRECDYVVFALSESSHRSKACMAEVQYADALRKPILPVLVGGSVPDQLLPPFLAETQRVDGRAGAGNQLTRDLARALLALPPPGPLPDPLPEPPEIPISYLDRLAAKVDAPGLDLAEQRNLLAELQREHADTDGREAAAVLLDRFRSRMDVYRAIADEIDVVLGHPGSPAGVRAPEHVAGGAGRRGAPATAARATAAQARPVVQGGGMRPPWPPLPSGPGAVPASAAARERRWPWILALGAVILVLLMIQAAIDTAGIPWPACTDVYGNPRPC